MIQGMGAEAGPSGPVLRVRATGELETVHYSPQPGVWVVELPEASWDQGAGLIVEPDLGIERAELNHVDEFGKKVSRLTVWLNEPAQLTLEPVRREGWSSPSPRLARDPGRRHRPPSHAKRCWWHRRAAQLGGRSARPRLAGTAELGRGRADAHR